MNINQVSDLLSKLSVADVKKLVDSNVNILYLLRHSMTQQEYLEFRKALKLVLVFISEPERVILNQMKIQRPDLHQFFQQNKMAYSWLLNNIHFIKKNI